MNRLLRLLYEFWFPEAPAARLAVLRILVGIFTFCLVAANYFKWVEIGSTSPALFKPVGVVAVLSQPLPPGVNQILIVATLIANILFLLGWRHQAAPVSRRRDPISRGRVHRRAVRNRVVPGLPRTA